jgi:hypothetical protein
VGGFCDVGALVCLLLLQTDAAAGSLPRALVRAASTVMGVDGAFPLQIYPAKVHWAYNFGTASYILYFSFGNINGCSYTRFIFFQRPAINCMNRDPKTETIYKLKKMQCTKLPNIFLSGNNKELTVLFQSNLRASLEKSNPITCLY